MLSEIAAPTHGFITNVGKAHLEGFGGVEGVKKGKGELYDYLKAHDAIAFVHAIDEKLMKMVDDRQMTLTVFYGNDGRALQMLEESPFIRFKEPITGEEFTAHISGKYNFDNIQTAYNIGVYFNIEISKACEALAAYNPDNNRSQKIEQGSNILFLDAYNAN